VCVEGRGCGWCCRWRGSLRMGNANFGASRCHVRLLCDCNGGRSNHLRSSRGRGKHYGRRQSQGRYIFYHIALLHSCLKAALGRVIPELLTFLRRFLILYEAKSRDIYIPLTQANFPCSKHPQIPIAIPPSNYNFGRYATRVCRVGLYGAH
jgi:hypothetical protein